MGLIICIVFCFKQKTAYEMRISDWSSDVCSSDLLQLLDLRFLSPDDSRFRNTLDVVEKALRRGSHMLRYATEDDFGLPETAFNFCTFWLIEALHFTDRKSTRLNSSH